MTHVAGVLAIAAETTAALACEREACDRATERDFLSRASQTAQRRQSRARRAAAGRIAISERK